MKSRILIFLSVAVLLSITMLGQSPDPVTSAPPATRRGDVQETLHGVTVSDPYCWLEDQESPETRAWINQQNDYTHKLLDSLPGRDRLEQRVSGLKRVERISTPTVRNGRFFYRKRAADQEQYVIYTRQGEAGKEDVLIDPNPMSADHSTNVEIMDVSKDGKLVAYVVRVGGKDETEVHVLDVTTKHDLTDVLPARAYFDISFLRRMAAVSTTRRRSTTGRGCGSTNWERRWKPTAMSLARATRRKQSSWAMCRRMGAT